MGWATSHRGDGDFGIDRPGRELAARREAFAPSGAWTWLRQEHGARVLTVEEPGQHAGAVADALVTDRPGVVLAVHTADCVPVVFVSGDGRAVGVAHAGWRGIVAGVLERTVAALGELGAVDVHAAAGPHIRARCYEFGADDLEPIVARCGVEARSRTGWGTPALDLLAAVQGVLGPLGVPVEDLGGCTACEAGRYFSHRARGDRGRMATVAHLDVAETGR